MRKSTEDFRRILKELKGARIRGAGCPLCFVHCPRTLNLDVFVDCKLRGQEDEEVKKDRIFPFNKRVLVSYSVLGTMMDLMWTEIKTLILSQTPRTHDGKQKPDTGFDG